MAKARVNLTLPEDDLQWLRQHADDEGRSISGQIAILIRRYRAEVEAQKRGS